MIAATIMGEQIAQERTLYIGVDGGGTKTYAVVTDEAFQPLGEGRAGPSNCLRVGPAHAALAVERSVALACLDAGVHLRDVRIAGMGIAGIDHPKHHAAMYRALRARFPFRTLLLTTDSRAAVAGAADLAPGVVIVAGTGSVAFGVDAEGHAARAGGWGPIMSDEGSGHYIAHRALAAVARATDGRLPPTSLVERVCARFGVETAEDLLPVIYDPSRKGLLDISDLSKAVEEEARRGDAVAGEILVDAGRELAELVVAVVRRLHLEETPLLVAYVGGVFNSGELVLDPLRDGIRRVAPHAELGEPLFGPAIGAAKLAVAGVRGADPGAAKERSPCR